MASPDFFLSWPSSVIESFDGSLNINIEEGNSSATFASQEVTDTLAYTTRNIPKPPPLPGKKICVKTNYPSRLADSCVPNETIDTWDKIFKEGFGADVYICTEDESIISAHISVLSVASPILGKFLQQSTIKNGIRFIKIPGIPCEAVRAFLRFLYSSRYEEDVMRNYVLHLLVLSHSFSIPSLKRVCIRYLEQGWMNTENVIDMLQLARKCDAPRLSFICCRMVVLDFKNIASTEAWKVMRRDDPALEQELLELVVDADSRKKERRKKNEEKKVYVQLHEAMEALLHICKDGCRTNGPSDKVLKGSQFPCNFPACKGLETLVRHFSICKTRVPGGCAHCKRLWQLLELHSRMCNTPDYCKVPLCRHFKEKMQVQTRKDDTKWKLLVSRVVAAKKAAQGPFSSRRSAFL